MTITINMTSPKNDEFYAILGRHITNTSIVKEFGEAITTNDNQIWFSLHSEETPNKNNVIAFSCIDVVDEQTAKLDWAWVDTQHRNQSMYDDMLTTRLDYIKQHTNVSTVKVIALPTSVASLERHGFVLHSKKGKYSWMKLQIQR